MPSKRADYSKKSRGHHKIRGKVRNMKKGVSVQSLNQNTLRPHESGQADRDLGKLRGF